MGKKGKREKTSKSERIRTKSDTWGGKKRYIFPDLYDNLLGGKKLNFEGGKGYDFWGTYMPLHISPLT